MQTFHQPQEIEVWYVIPSIRREIAKELKNAGVSGTRISQILGLTKAAVSQYLSDKRAKKLDFPKDILKKIKASSKRLKENKSTSTEEVQKLLQDIRNTKLLCKFHKQHCVVEKECTVCVE